MNYFTQFKFDLFPAEDKNIKNSKISNVSFIQPRTYIFRGIFMNWLKEFNPKIGNKLHSTQPKNTIIHIRDYSIQQDFIYPGGGIRGGGRKDSGGRKKTGKRNRSPNRRNRMPKGLRYTVNSFDDEISSTLLQFMMKQQNQFVNYGPQRAVITQVEIRQKNIDDFIKKADSKILKSIRIKFITPTRFSIYGSSKEMRLPLPEYVFGGMERQWNSKFLDTPNEIPIDFREWVKNHISISSYDLKTRAWSMGKKHKFVGFTGWTKFLIDMDNESSKDRDYCSKILLLAKYCEYSGVGTNKTAGFGRISVF